MKARLAPLCGVTDTVFREICFDQGCELAYTEMISAMGYLVAPGQRATRELMTRGPREKKLIVQLFGKEPEVVAEAAARMCALQRYDGVDLNFGCPARKVAVAGEGSGLMRTPDTARRIMAETVKACRLPVSVKMRLGWDEDHRNALEIARMAEDAGISEITIHGRTREQQYSGEADWDQIGEVAAKVRIPVIGNGDIFTAEDAMRCCRIYPVSGVMIGRGVMGNPWIFRDIQALSRGEEPREVTLEERLSMIRYHYDKMMEGRPEHIAVREMRKHISWYLKGIRGAGKIRADINRAETPAEVERILAEVTG